MNIVYKNMELMYSMDVSTCIRLGEKSFKIYVMIYEII